MYTETQVKIGIIVWLDVPQRSNMAKKMANTFCKVFISVLFQQNTVVIRISLRQYYELSKEYNMLITIRHCSGEYKDNRIG